MKATVHLDAYALASLHVKVRKTEGKKNTRKIKACIQKPNIISTAPSLKKLGRSCLIPPWNGNPQKTAVHDNAQNTWLECWQFYSHDWSQAPSTLEHVIMCSFHVSPSLHHSLTHAQTQHSGQNCSMQCCLHLLSSEASKTTNDEVYECPSTVVPGTCSVGGYLIGGAGGSPDWVGFGAGTPTWARLPWGGFFFFFQMAVNVEKPSEGCNSSHTHSLPPV